MEKYHPSSVQVVAGLQSSTLGVYNHQLWGGPTEKSPGVLVGYAETIFFDHVHEVGKPGTFARVWKFTLEKFPIVTNIDRGKFRHTGLRLESTKKMFVRTVRENRTLGKFFFFPERKLQQRPSTMHKFTKHLRKYHDFIVQPIVLYFGHAL